MLEDLDKETTKTKKNPLFKNISISPSQNPNNPEKQQPRKTGVISLPHHKAQMLPFHG